MDNSSRERTLRKKAAAIARGLGIDFGSSDDSLEEWSSGDERTTSSSRQANSSHSRNQQRLSRSQKEKGNTPTESQLPHYMRPTCAASRKNRGSAVTERAQEEVNVLPVSSTRAVRSERQQQKRNANNQGVSQRKKTEPRMRNARTSLDIHKIVDNAIADAFRDDGYERIPKEDELLSQKTGQLDGKKESGKKETHDPEQEQSRTPRSTAKENETEKVTKTHGQNHETGEFEAEEDLLRRRAAELEADIRRLKEKKALKTLHEFRANRESELHNALSQFESERRKTLLESSQMLDAERHEQKKLIADRIEHVQNEIERLLKTEQELKAEAKAIDSSYDSKIRLLHQDFESEIAEHKARAQNELDRDIALKRSELMKAVWEA